MGSASDKIRVNSKTKKTLYNNKNTLGNILGKELSFDEYINILLMQNHKIIVVPNKKRKKKIKKDDFFTLSNLF